MKTQRRQQLKTNELSVYLQELTQYVRANATTIVVIGVILVVLIAAVLYRHRSTARAAELGWQDYQDVLRASATPEPGKEDWGATVIDQWEALIGSNDDPQVQARSVWGLAQFCLRQFVESDDEQVRQVLLQKAESNCRLIVDQHSSNTTLYAAALNGLAAVEENRFVLGGDPAHKQRAKAYLEQLRDEHAFVGTPFQADALARLNEFEAVWKPLVLVEPPPPPPPAEEPPTADPDGSAMTPPDSDAEPVEDTPNPSDLEQEREQEEEQEPQATPEPAPGEP